MKIIIRVVLVSLFAIFGLSAWAGTAGAVQAAPALPSYLPSSQYICDLGDLNCIQHSSGGLTTVSPGNLGNDDRFTAETTSVCGGGVVTSTCPNLPAGYNNSSNYGGDLIVCLRSSAGGYMKGNGGGSFVTIESSCNGNDNYWIVHNATFVNVADTIGGGVGRFLTEQNNFHVVDMGGVTDQSKWEQCLSC